MSGPVVVRRVAPGEWALWRDVRLEALAVSPEAFKARLADWADGGERRWRERLAMPGAYNVVAERDGRAVGVARGVPEDRDAWLHSVWVSPDARGLGVGGRLVGAIEEWARGRGVRTLWLAVLPGNEAAIGLYRRLGFVRTDEVGELMPDGVTRELVMAKTKIVED